MFKGLTVKYHKQLWISGMSHFSEISALFFLCQADYSLENQTGPMTWLYDTFRRTLSNFFIIFIKLLKEKKLQLLHGKPSDFVFDKRRWQSSWQSAAAAGVMSVFQLLVFILQNAHINTLTAHPAQLIKMYISPLGRFQSSHKEKNTLKRM